MRFGALLIPLGVLAVTPWWVARYARSDLDGAPRQVAMAASLRYRLLEIELRLKSTGAQRDKPKIRALMSEQQRVLVQLINGDPATDLPPCPSATACSALAADLQRWSQTLEPALRAALDGPPSATDAVSPLVSTEFAHLDHSLFEVATAFQSRAASVDEVGQLTGFASLLLTGLIGFGVWEVFGKVRRLKTAAAHSEQAVIDEVHGDHELAELAQALADGLKAARVQREADARRLTELGEQQLAMRRYANALSAWVTGSGTLEPALQELAKATGYVEARFEEPGDFRICDACFVEDNERVLPIAWRDEQLGALRLGAVFKRRGDSEQANATLDMFVQLLTVATLARHVLAELTLRAQVARDLAGVTTLKAGPSTLGTSLGRLIPHDVAILEVVDETGRCAHCWNVEPDHLARVPCSENLVIPEGTLMASGSDLEHGMRAELKQSRLLLRIPLRVGGQVAGRLQLGRRDEPFTEHEVQTADALSVILASTLLRMRMTERIRLAQEWDTIGAFGRLVADQLRNPLNNLSLQAELLERRITRLDGQAQTTLGTSVQLLRSELERMNGVFTDYLSLHPASGSSRFERFDLCEVVDSALAGTRDLMEEHEVRLEARLRPGPAPVVGHQTRLRTTVCQLIENAVEAMKNSPERRLSLAMHEHDKDWELAIRDTGPGIVDPVAIFSPGYTTKPSGTGMGLALCLHTVLQHHGRLVARLVGETGSEFSITLPKESALGVRPH